MALEALSFYKKGLKKKKIHLIKILLKKTIIFLLISNKNFELQKEYLINKI